MINKKKKTTPDKFDKIPIIFQIEITKNGFIVKKKVFRKFRMKKENISMISQVRRFNLMF